MFWLDTADKSTVMAFEDTDSAPLELVLLKSTTGALSSSLMVYVWVSSLPRVALLGFDKVRITVSLASSAASLIIFEIVMVPDVCPALMVSVPLARV